MPERPPLLTSELASKIADLFTARGAAASSEDVQTLAHALAGIGVGLTESSRSTFLVDVRVYSGALARGHEAEERATRLAAFAKDALREFWTRDSADMQEFGVKHGLLVEAIYDPALHGDVDDSAPGDTIYVRSDWFKAALAALEPPAPAPPPPSLPDTPVATETAP